MPLTSKGKDVAKAMKKTYGSNWKQVFYASINAGKLTGTHPKNSRWEKQAKRARRKHSAATKAKISRGVKRAKRR